ncbi:hypothetical protein Nepgr_019900 [Nepenthes gracilis]|uniref:Uncharacterized protein n=1 Tax=Nepenthes gracilis TaxID=150966 RepID=A0AAD3XVI0_NEPGR|nr:hypothetical protein Nepgr_019900 [Nepenthes gracilis]
MGRTPCCDKGNVKRGAWSIEEDALLKNYIQKYGTGGNWITLPKKAGLNRCGKSCRLRWLNYLRPDIKRGAFTKEEDYIICSLYNIIGSRWSVIAAKLPGRTDNEVKNYWNTTLKKKISAGQQLTTTKSSTQARSAPSSASTTSFEAIESSAVTTYEDANFSAVLSPSTDMNYNLQNFAAENAWWDRFQSPVAGVDEVPGSMINGESLDAETSINQGISSSVITASDASSHASLNDRGVTEEDEFWMDMFYDQFPSPYHLVNSYELEQKIGEVASLLEGSAYANLTFNCPNKVTVTSQY